MKGKGQKRKKGDEKEGGLKILIADDSPDAIEQISFWIQERWPEAGLYKAQTPEEAFSKATDQRIENLLLDLDFVAPRASGVAIARSILQARSEEKDLRTRILFRTVHAGDLSYLHQIEKLVNDEGHKPDVWGFVDKGAMPKRLVQNAIEQVFVYELSFTDIFSQQLRDSPSREFSNLEFTVLLYICLGVTNDGIGWLVGTSRQSVERILSGLYQKMKIPTRRDAPQGVPALLESRGRLYYEAMTRGLVNPHLLREEDTALRERVEKNALSPDRLYIDQDWLGRKQSAQVRHIKER